MTKHKHYEAIMAWASGAEIEYSFSHDIWHPVDKDPIWDLLGTFRIKQAPKPDVVREVLLVNSLSAGPLLYAASPLECNCVLVFDGETNKLKGCTFKAA
tara:strand:- start:25 stop:321 length:297 start_codon:yes stop_codon:yes gene_type:complete